MRGLWGERGRRPGTSPRTCPQCGGRGTQSRDQGLFALSTSCTRCGGRARIVETPCPRCRGNGKTRGVKQVKVRIPAGARDGMKVRVPGRGSAGRNGGPAGDLFVVTRVEEHPVFKRKGDDFVVHVPVSFVEAALGARDRGPQARGRDGQAQVTRRHPERQAVQGEGGRGAQDQDGAGPSGGPHRAGRGRRAEEAQASGA